MKLTLRARILGAILTTIITIIVAGSLFQLTYYRHTLKRTVISQIRFQAKQLLSNTHMAIYEYIQTLTAISHYPILEDDPSTSCKKLRKFLREVVVGHSDVVYIDFVNADGKVCASSVEKRCKMDLKSREEFRKLQGSGEDVYVSPIQGVGKDAYVIIASRVLTEYGTFFGIMRMKYIIGHKLIRMFDILEREQFYSSIVLDKSGRVRIASSAMEDMIGKSVDEPSLASMFEQRGFLSASASSIGYKSYLGEKLTAILLYPKELALAPMYAFLKAFLWFTSVVSVVLMVLLVFVLDRFLQPVVQLTKFTQEVTRSGDLDKRLPVRQNDEVGVLTESFNNMLKWLKEKQSQIQRSEERNRRLIEAASQLGEGFLIVQKIGDSDWTIVEWNSTATKLLGISSSKEGLPRLTDIILPDSVPGFYTQLSALRSRLLSHVPASTAEVHDVRNDRTITIELSATTTDYQGEEAIAIIFRDITERLEMQRQIMAAQKFEVLGSMASGFAHDFNNILTGLFGYIELLKTRTTDPKAGRYVEELEKIAQRAADMVKSMLLFSRRRPESVSAIVLRSVIDEVLSLSRNTMPKHITIETSGDLDLQVNGDHTQLVQVFLNLILNAKDAIVESGKDVGRIEISVREVKKQDLAFLPGGKFYYSSYVRIDVSDNGKGMTEEERAHLFEPFYTTKGEKGTGLGLAITYRVVQNHEGQILVDSQPGVGSTFSIFLPRSFKPAKKYVDAKPASGRIKGSVLVVDDEATIRNSLKTVLSSLHINVATATNGQHALDILAKRRFDLIIMDVVMPRMDGWKLLDELSKLDPMPEIIVMSGQADMDSERLAVARAVLKKPFALSELSNLVVSILKELQEDRSGKNT